MNPITEGFMREVRKALAVASLAERSGQIPLADMAGAIALKKMELAVAADTRATSVTEARYD